MENIKEYCVVNVTTDNFDNAQHISKILLTERLAACCSIIPNISSIYCWNGNINTSNEYLIIIKTRKDKFETLQQRISELHKYEVPEIICTAITAANKSYLEWIDETLDM